MAYKPEEPSCEATNERLEQFSFFLDKEEYNKFFVWVDFESGELQMDFYSAPKFYERGKCRTRIFDSNRPLLRATL